MSELASVAVEENGRETGSAPTANLARALIQAQRNAKEVQHDKRNKHHDFAYTSAEAIMAEARVALNAAGLAVIQSGWWATAQDVEWTDADGKVSKDQERTLHVKFAVIHESGERMDSEIEVPILPEKGRPVDKATFAALTFAESYYLRGLLCLPRVSSTDDIDQRDDTAHAPRPAARASAPPKLITNKVTAPCSYCNADVDAGKGYSRQDDAGAWRSIHRNCLTALKAESAGAP